MATPAIRDIRKAHPSAHIALLVGTWSAPAVRNSPHIDELIEVDDHVFLGRRRWLDIFRLLIRIRRGGFDSAFIFHPLAAVHAFAWLAGIPKRYGLTNNGTGRFLTQVVKEDLGAETYYPLNFQRVVALAGIPTGTPDLEVHSSEADKAATARLLAEHGIHDEDDLLLVAPGGGRNSKEDVAARRWPAEKFAQLVQNAMAARPRLKVVVTGAASDARETGVVASMVPGAVNLTARTTLTQLYALAYRARVVICNDSSLLHVAVACRKPVVTPFGPTAASQRLPAWAREYSVQSGIPCSPCYIGGRFPGCPIRFECLREMTVDTVRAGLDRAFAGETGMAPSKKNPA